MLVRLFITTLTASYVFSQHQTCKKSPTESVLGQKCSNEIIFEDDFNDLNSQKWWNTRRISSGEDEEFVVFDNNLKNIYVEDGKLFIHPTLMPDDTVSSGVIDLKMCTGRFQTSDCFLRAVSYNILPPVESAQISTKDFYFKYGKVEIRAKLPSGDWIYPEIWLEPEQKEYGQLFNSGRIIIASVHGNKELKTANGEDISNKLLKAGIVLGVGERVYGKSALVSLKSRKSWCEDFHNFTFIWKPDSMEIIVDRHPIVLISPDSLPISGQFNFTPKEKQSVWTNSSSLLAPFDKNFKLVLGVAVGGKREFPDGSTTLNFHKKPWQNTGSVKRLLNFWKDRDNWYPTWSGKDSALQVDYVKVTAI